MIVLTHRVKRVTEIYPDSANFAQAESPPVQIPRWCELRDRFGAVIWIYAYLTPLMATSMGTCHVLLTGWRGDWALLSIAVLIVSGPLICLAMIWTERTFSFNVRLGISLGLLIAYPMLYVLEGLVFFLLIVPLASAFFGTPDTLSIFGLF